MPKTYSPPRCPECGRELNIVFTSEEHYYEFNSWEGRYKLPPYQEVYTITCGNCGAEVSELFPDGVCNYSRKGVRRCPKR